MTTLENPLRIHPDVQIPEFEFETRSMSILQFLVKIVKADQC